jgi:hypothetical protein
MDNMSPEEILRRREDASEFVYDDPVDQYSDQLISNYLKPNQDLSETENEREEPAVMEDPSLEYEPEIKPDPSIIKPIYTDHKTESVNHSINHEPVNPNREQSNIEHNHMDSRKLSEVNSFGKAQSISQSPAFDTGWKNVPVSILPSRGLFYPDGTKMAIRSAEVKEIRHFSMIDEDDRLDIEEKLSYVLERCLRIDFPGEGVVSYRDLKQEDRFFLILAIRDLTFTRGENSILLKPKKKCKETKECAIGEGIELRTGVLSSYELDDRILNYYNHETKGFTFDIKRINKRIEMFVPSIGVNQKISEFITDCASRKRPIDDGFLKIAPFIFGEWRDLTNESIYLRMRESDYWTKEEYSLYFELSEKIKIGTILEVKVNCPACGEEAIADIAFPSGLRSLFVISDIFGELL